MERTAKRDAQLAATSPKAATGKRQPKRTEGARPSADEFAAFYADMVNSDGFLPANTISNMIRDALLSRGLVTPSRNHGMDAALTVIPQPGNFYGGWVTPNLNGQIKGAPGTQHG